MFWSAEGAQFMEGRGVGGWGLWDCCWDVGDGGHSTEPSIPRSTFISHAAGSITSLMAHSKYLLNNQNHSQGPFASLLFSMDLEFSSYAMGT